MIIRILFLLLFVSIAAHAQDSSVVKKQVVRENLLFTVEYKFKNSRKKVKKADITVYAEQRRGRRKVYSTRGLLSDSPDSLVYIIFPK